MGSSRCVCSAELPRHRVSCFDVGFSRDEKRMRTRRDEGRDEGREGERSGSTYNKYKKVPTSNCRHDDNDEEREEKMKKESLVRAIWSFTVLLAGDLCLRRRNFPFVVVIFCCCFVFYDFPCLGGRCRLFPQWHKLPRSTAGWQRKQEKEEGISVVSFCCCCFPLI